MSVIGGQNIRIAPDKGFEVLNGRDLAMKVNAATMQVDADGVGVKNGAITPAQLESGLASIQNDALKRGFWSSITTVHSITASQQPASLADALFTGRSAGGAVNGNGTVGVVSASFNGSVVETGTTPGQGGLGSVAAGDQPYNGTDFPGQRGILAVLNKADGDDVLLSNVLSTAAGGDINARVYGYLSYRSDLGADAHWRLWYYYRAAANGLETPFTPDITLAGVTIHIAEVGLAKDIPPRASLGIVSPAGQAAAAVGPKSIGTTELDDGSVTSVKLANDAVTAAKVATDAVTTPKIQNDAVTAPKLATDAVTTAKIASDAVISSKIATDAVLSPKIKMRRRFQRIAGVAANGATLTLSRTILASREEAVVVTEDNAFIDFVASNPDTNPSKEFTASGNAITLGFTQVQDAVYRVWFDSEDA
jgi:hypothetical protein